MLSPAVKKTAEKPFDPQYFKEELAAALIIIEHEDVPPEDYDDIPSAVEEVGARVPRGLRALYRLRSRLAAAAAATNSHEVDEAYYTTLRVFENMLFLEVSSLSALTSLDRLAAGIDLLLVSDSWQMFVEKGDEEDPEPEPLPDEDEEGREEAPNANEWHVRPPAPVTKH